MAEENYVKLQLNKPVTMRFDAFAWGMHKVKDPIFGFDKTVKALAFHVIEVDFNPADTVFSLISTVAQKEFEPYLEADRYKRYKFQMIKTGDISTPPRIMTAIPL
uniref:Uncharacterized protein n=1 Tax=viral metagenome TaxID=1070528 RepID=A0A6H2A239_9ZZZZ